MEYDVAKKMGDYKLASSIIAENHAYRNKRWEDEVNNIISGLQSNPVDTVYQKIFVCLPPRVQSELLVSHISSKFDKSAARADFILQFLKNKSNLLEEISSTVETLLGKLINLLISAEEDHFQSMTSRPDGDEDIPDTPLSPEESVSIEKAEDVSMENRDADEGEEGEVIEEVDDDYDELIDDDDGDNLSHRRLDGKRTTRVLNVYRMRLACEVLPMIHRMRNAVKINIPLLHTLVTNSLQFIFTFVVHVPLSTDGHPKISGLFDVLPDLLQMDPIKLLRLYLDMASDLLKWTVKGSFQMQTRSDILETLKKTYHSYRELDHDFHIGGVSASLKKRNHNILSATGNQVASMFWALFIETSLEYLKECRLRACVPFNISAVTLLPLDQSSVASEDALAELLQMFQSLIPLRQRFKAQEKKSKSRQVSRKGNLKLEDMFAAFKPQSNIESDEFSCLLEFISRLGLTFSSLNEDCEETFTNSVFISSCFDEEQSRIIQCLLSIMRLHLKPPKKAKDIAFERQRLVHRMNELEVTEDSANHTWSKLSNQVVTISLLNADDAMEVCLAAVEQWLVEAVEADNIEAACLVVVLHQNPLWTRIQDLKCEHTTDVITFLKSNWSKARILFSEWLKAGFIHCPSLLSLIVKLEISSNAEEKFESEICDLCVKLIQASKGAVLPSLMLFLRNEMKRIKSCINMSKVVDIFNSLSNSNRRDRKICLSQAISSLKSPLTQSYLDEVSASKWLGRVANAFTWKSVCEIIQHILQDELRVLISRRVNTNIVSTELSDSFRLLNIFLSCGLQTDLKLPLNETLTFLYGILTDSILSHLQPLAIDAISSLLWHLPPETQSLETSSISNLQNWCFDQMKTSPSGPVALLLCHTVEASFYSQKTLQCGFTDLIKSVLTCFDHGWSDTFGLGWFLRLFRWTVVKVCVTPEIHRSAIECFLKRAPLIFKMWNNFRETGCQSVSSSYGTLPFLAVGDKASPILAQKIGECLTDPYALDSHYITSPLLENLFCIRKITDAASSISLLGDACFLADQEPTLLPGKHERRPQPNSIDTGRELLALSRWILNTCLVLNSVEFAKEIESFCRLLVVIFTSEWSRYCDRLRFQAEESSSSQMLGMQDFLATFGDLLVTLEVFNMTENLDALRLRLSINEKIGIYGCLAYLLTADETVSWLWWPVFDWTLRFQWQRAVAVESFCEFNWFEALAVISNALGAEKRSLAIELAISTSVTALNVTVYCLQKETRNFDETVPFLDRIWDQALIWFEQLLATNVRDDSRYKNEKRRALTHDRLICCLFEGLVQLDSMNHGFISGSRSRSLSQLWQILLSTPVFANPLVPWRYRLAISAFLVYPKISMEVVYSLTKSELPPPLVLLFENASGFDIHRCYYLHWSLDILLYPEKSTSYEFPRGEVVPEFGEKHRESIEKFIKVHLSEPQDLWKRLFWHLISRDRIEAHFLEETLDFLLADLEQRNSLSFVIFELLDNIPCQQWPTRLDSLIHSLLIAEGAQMSASVIDLDLDICDLQSSSKALSIGDEEGNTDAKSNFVDSKIKFPLIAFSRNELLAKTLACLQNIVSKLSWKSGKDTKWLVTFLQYLRNAKLPTSANETATELFCCLIDALKDAIKMQLVLKRYFLFLQVIAGLNNFGLILCEFATRAGVEGNEMWEKIAEQVVKLTGTAWMAGVSRWPKMEEQFLPPSVSSVFCDAAAVKFKVFRLLQRFVLSNHQIISFFRLSSQPKGLPPRFASNFVGFLSENAGPKSSPSILYTLDAFLFILVTKSTQWEFDFQVTVSEKENMPCSSSAHLLKKGSSSQSSLSLIVSVCCCLIKHSESTKLIQQILLKRLANESETYFKQKLSPYLLPLCLWEISNGQFDRSAHSTDFDNASKAWGFLSFDDFIGKFPLEYDAFLRLAAVEPMERRFKEAEPIHIAAHLFGKETFVELMRSLKSDRKRFHAMSHVESLVDISSHLFRFLLLFVSDSTNTLEHNAALLNHYLLSRLSILLVHFFPACQVDSDEVSRILFSCLTLEDMERKASRILSKSVSLNSDFVLKFAEGLLAAASFLLGDFSQSARASLFDPLGGCYPRVSIWLGVAGFLHLLISASSVVEVTENYMNWRLVSGIIDLIDTEYQRSRFGNIGFLLTSLSKILQGILKKNDITPSGQLEISWHNSLVYLLAEIASKLPSLPDIVHFDLSEKIDHILGQLFHASGGTRFSNAICQLDNEVRRLLRSLDSLRHPNLLKYRETGLRHLSSLFQIEHKLSAIKLHEYMTILPQDLAESKARSAESSTVQNWVPAAGSNDDCDPANQDRRRLSNLLIGLLTANQNVDVDSATRSAVAECIASLNADLNEGARLFESLDGVRKIFIDNSSNPLVVEQVGALVTIINKSISPKSVCSRLGPQCLLEMLSDSRLRSSLFENVNIAESERDVCLVTKLAPYVSKEELNAIRCSDTQNSSKFTAKNISETALEELTSNNLIILVEKCDEQSNSVILKIADWLFEKELVLDDFFMACRPLILAELSLAKRLVPWIFAVLMANLKLNMNSRAKELAERALCGLIRSLNCLLGNRKMENFLQSVIIAVHSYSQWLVRSGVALRMEWDFERLTSSKSALSTNTVANAWLFFELEWLKRQSEMFHNDIAQSLWIDLCKTKGDFEGLKAAQIAMAPFFEKSTDLENRFRCAIAELDGRWNSSLSADDADATQIALRLHQIGADRAFDQLTSSLSLKEADRIPPLIEAKYRVAWRSHPWKIDASSQSAFSGDSIPLGIDFKTRSRVPFVQVPTASNLSLQRERFGTTFSDSIELERTRQACISLLGDWNAGSNKAPPSRESEKFVYLLQKSVCSGDWKHVAKLVNNRRVSSVNFLISNRTNLCEFASEMSLLRAWNRVCDLEDNNQSSPRGLSPLILLQTSIQECVCKNYSQPSSLLEASIRLAKAISDTGDDISLLNVHAQLQLAELYLDHGRELYAEQLLRNMPHVNASSQILNLKRDLAVAFTRSKLQHSCNETSLSCVRLDGALQEISRCIPNLNISHDLPTRLLLESYLSSTVVLCKWLVESGTMGWADLISQKLKPAIELTEKCWPPEVKPGLQSSVDASAALAEFADAQFQAIDAYLKSPEFAARRRLLADANADAACLTEVDKRSRFLRLLQRQSTIESAELSNLFSNLQTFFSSAILSYCQCLAQSDKYNLKIYRLVSLWLNAASQVVENRGLAGSSFDGAATSKTLFTASWLTSLSSHLARIREDKFLPLFPQLLVRFTTYPDTPGSENKAQTELRMMLERLVKALLHRHPYHTGFPLLSLVNAELDDTEDTPTGSNTASRAKRARLETPADRGATREVLARQLFEEICSANEGSRASLFGQMQNLARAYIEWANVNAENKRGTKGDIPLPSNCSLWRLSKDADRCLNLLTVVTCPPRVDPSGTYSDLVRVVGFANTYRLAGGLNLPKIVTALCSDGRRRRQLIKGKDDPRQDAIMQQIFSAANHLLATFAVSDGSKGRKPAPATRIPFANPMRIRTYIVVPLARRSGVIEWCEGTIPLGEWLANDSSGAHQRYHPADLPPNQAKIKLASARDKPIERRMAIFSEICSKIQPVLGYYFVEHFPEANAWYAAKRRYTTSLAASSILGYLVGLGDRHPQNLLLHPLTGEIVHIDLGIAFDQGRLMPTPEVVPFRLTRDLVHALGPLGVETGFVGAAESALRAFSSASEVILTLLEVLLHDPLYSWSLSPAQLCALEARRAEVTGGSVFPGGESSIFGATTNASMLSGGYAAMSRRPKASVNQLAERVLLTVRDKLAGRVGGIGSGGLIGSAAGGNSLGTLEPAGHVSLLVRAATDPNNLGRMYFGWQAYL
ncbi:hypothetical protein Aperf_G00000017064 [Anoplocephala perfoliata]